MYMQMKRFWMNKSFWMGLLPLLALAVVLAGLDVWTGWGLSLSLAVVVPGVTGRGVSVSDEPLTADITRQESADLLRNEIDQRIVKIRPMSTPIDQIMRHSEVRKSGSMVYDYYAVDTKPTKAKISTAYTEPTAGTATSSHKKATLETDNNDIFDVSETILVKGVNGYEADGKTKSSADLVLYVSKKSDDGKLVVYALNGKTVGQIDGVVPSIPKDTVLVRMGRAATELDVQTSQFEALPVKAQNYCQIFKMQVEQSTFQKIANKEVEWNFSDSEECAIFDMRMGMEKSFMFGVKNSIYDADKKQNVMTTGGIWWQAGKEKAYDPTKGLTQNDLIDIMQEAFTGNAGNKRKVLVGGSNFIGLINKLDVQKYVGANEDFVKWGIDFTEIRSKFGKLYVLLDEVFDDCNMSDYGFIFDPEYLTKAVHVPFDRLQLDLKKAGIRNTDAVVLTEASCACLRYPNAHMRIVPKG
ncbi:MAG: DUF5309 family protein [Coprobacter sp.]|nr:DUF5309 family protein [Coprobacter sp.]